MLGIVAVVACLTIGADDGKAAILVEDPSYRPKVGDRAVLYCEDEAGKPFRAWCATASYHYRDYSKALKINDEAGLLELRNEKHVFGVPPGTAVLLLEREEFPTGGDGIGINDAWVVRILEGPNKAAKLYTPHYNVVRLIEKPEPVKAEPPKPKGPALGELFRKALFAHKAGLYAEALEHCRAIIERGPETPDAAEAAGLMARIRAERQKAADRARVNPDDVRAEQLVRLGRNLEKAGKSKAALDYYRQVVREYPKSPAAKTAAGRVKALAPR